MRVDGYLYRALALLLPRGPLQCVRKACQVGCDCRPACLGAKQTQHSTTLCRSLATHLEAGEIDLRTAVCVLHDETNAGTEARGACAGVDRTAGLLKEAGRAHVRLDRRRAAGSSR